MTALKQVNLLLIFTLFISLQCMGQLKVDEETGLLKNEKLIVVEAAQKQELYQKCQDWISLHFAHHNQVITSHNATRGIIVGQYFEDYKVNLASKEFYNFIRFYIRDNMVKVIINNIRDSNSDSKVEKYLFNNDGTSKERFETTFTDIDKNTSLLIKSLEAFILTQD